MSRRNFLKTTALGATGLVGGGNLIAEARAQSLASNSSLQAKANAISKKLFANDGLAMPIATKPTISKLAKGLDRTMVLGGGGEYYIAWYYGLMEAGLKMDQLPEMVVGTSAGSYVGSSLLSGHFQRLRTEFDFLVSFRKSLPRSHHCLILI